MNVSIYSREAIEKRIVNDFPANTAVISFYDPKDSKGYGNCTPVDYHKQCERIFYVCIYDIDFEILGDYGLNYDTYFPEVDELADFIIQAEKDGLDIICQCEYGQSRSAACAAAILEHFYHNGISIFADYRYYPNQMLFRKMLDALGNFSSILIDRHRQDNSTIKDILIVTDSYNEINRDSYNVGIFAYIDLSNGVLKKGEGIITVNDKDDTYMTPEGIKPKQIYHIKAVLIKDNDFLVTEIIERDVKNPILKFLLEEYNKPIIINDNILGTIILKRNHGFFTSEVSWLAHEMDIIIWSEEITSEIVETLYKAYEELKMFAKYILDNATQEIVIQELQVFHDGKHRISACLYISSCEKISIFLDSTTEDGVYSFNFSLYYNQELHSFQEIAKMFDGLNTLGMEKSAVNNNNHVGIWWYTDNGEIWDESIPIYKGVLSGIYIQYSDNDNHLTLWSSVVKKHIKDTALQQNMIGKGYKSIERGRVIYNTVTMKYEITCSEKMIRDTAFRKNIVAHYQLAEGSFEFVQLNHYYKIELTGNPMLDEYIENNQL